MGLTKGQADKVIKLFSLAFVGETDEQQRKILLCEFEDNFKNSIADWEMLCKSELEKLTSDIEIIECFERLIQRKANKVQGNKYEIREFRKSDFQEVRIMINRTFSMCLTMDVNKAFNQFMKSEYSFVICNGDEILGVILAYLAPDLHGNMIYIDTLVVGETVRGIGLGKQLLSHLMKKASSNDIHQVSLQTDRNIDAYNIYRHWNFDESKYVTMKKFFV